MRKVVLVCALALACGCAHHKSASNLAKRQTVAPPKGDFESGHKRDSRQELEPQQSERPVVTPPAS
jgi:hypothetical protein